jgi:PPOX class probable F420-dependent enzyme
VWFAADPANDLASDSARLYAYTIGNSGKVKRIRNNARVRIAPCNAGGKLLGEWVEARAEIVTGPEAEYGDSLLNKKYLPWKQLLNFFASFRRRSARVGFVIRPA